MSYINSVVRGMFPRASGKPLKTMWVFIDPTNTKPILRGTPVVLTGATITRAGKTLPAIKAVAIDAEDADADNGALKTTGTPIVVYDSSFGVVSGVAATTAGAAEITYESDQEYELVIDGTGYDGTASKSYINFTAETATPVTSPFVSPSNGGGSEASSSNVQLDSGSASSDTRNFKVLSVADPRDAVSTANVTLRGVIAAYQAP